MTHLPSNSSKIAKRNLSYLPLIVQLKSVKDFIVIDRYKETDRNQIYAILKEIIDEGQSYSRTTLDEHDFEEDYVSNDFFIARCSETGLVVGSICIKANFPGRSSHICNAGFAVRKDQRRKGIGEILYKSYLRIARDLGYEGSLFKLVYISNRGAVHLCRQLGFIEVGFLPKAAKLKDIGYSDAFQFYYDLSTLNDIGEPIYGWPK